MSVVIETTKGVFTVDLYIEQRPKSEYINFLYYDNFPINIGIFTANKFFGERGTFNSYLLVSLWGHGLVYYIFSAEFVLFQYARTS